MRNPNNTDTTAVELLPRYTGLDDTLPWSDELERKQQSTGQTSTGRSSWSPRKWDEVVYATAFALCFAPVAILAGMSPELSKAMGGNGCLPSGDFVIPFTSSVWDINHFFTITIPFAGSGWTSCSTSAWQDTSSACLGYSFTKVKVIDMAWDVFVGRGVQVCLIWIAYRLFRRALDALMQEGEIGFDVFECVAFTSGTLRSLVPLFKHTLGWAPLPRSKHAGLLYAAMSVATIYIVSVPTLLSGITGYASYYVPLVNVQDYDLGNVTTNATDYIMQNSGIIPLNCRGSLDPVWGQLGSYKDEEEYYTSQVQNVLDDGKAYWDWPDYYQRYKDSIYSHCPREVNITTCAAANVTTYVLYGGKGRALNDNTTLLQPAPGLVTWPDSLAGHSSHWQCGYQIFETSQFVSLDQSGLQNQVAGSCQAGSGYVWGFSFLFTFLVSVLNLVFGAIMYGIWLDIRRFARLHGRPGTLKDATILTRQAKQRFGDESDEWSAQTLTEKVTQGKVGMTASTMGLKKRRDEESRSRRLSGASFGDPGRGDWGGEVIEDHDHVR